MSLKITVISIFNRLLARAKAVPWRNPLLHTWGLLAGGLLIAGIGAHYGRHGVAGEKNNFGAATGLLRPGSLEVLRQWTPPVVFSSGTVAPTPEASPLELDLRAFASRAADQSAWKFLSADLRKRLMALPACGRTITVAWSGTPGGDAAALDWYYTGTLGLPGGAPYDFVIGNGSRGRDGHIEVTRRWLAGKTPESRPVAICLFGEKTTALPTPAQEAALGELIAGIEARSGSVILAMQQPRDRRLLADVD